MAIKAITKSTKRTLTRASSLLKKSKEPGLEIDNEIISELLNYIEKGYILINEIRGEITRLQKTVQKRRGSFFFRKGKRKNESYDISKIADMRRFHKEMKEKLKNVRGMEKRILEMHCTAQGNLLQTLIYDYFEIVGKIDDTKSRLKNKMSEIGFENAAFHYENELMPTNEERIVRFHVPESMEANDEISENVKAIEDVEEKVDEVHFLYNAIDIAVHGQGDTIDNIEKYAKEGAEQLEAGMKKTAKTAKQHKYCTVLKIISYVFAGALLVIFLLTVATLI